MMRRLNSHSVVGGTYYISTVELHYDTYDAYTTAMYAIGRYYKRFASGAHTGEGGIISCSYNFEEIEEPLCIGNDQYLTVIWCRSNYDLEFIGIKYRVNGRAAIRVLHSRRCASRSIAAVNLDDYKNELNPKYDVVEDLYDDAFAAGVTKNHWVIINATELLAIDSTTHSIITVPYELTDDEEV